MGAIRFIPPLANDTGGPASRKLDAISTSALARGAAEIQRGEPSSVLPQLARGGTAGGAFPKALVVAYPDGTLSVGPPDGPGDPCLLKFDLSPRSDSIPTEHVYALMARAAGIRAVETRLIAEDRRTKRRHLLVRRFDIPSPQNASRRFHFHTVSGLLNRAPGNLDYRDLFRTAIRLHVAPGELRELARRMIFNVLASNHDDHGKNHAFLYDETDRTWSFTPAYDLTFSSGMLERGMTVCGEVWPASTTMESLCADAGLSRSEYRATFEQVSTALNRWKRLAKQAEVPAPAISEIADRHRQIRERVDRTGGAVGSGKN